MDRFLLTIEHDSPSLKEDQPVVVRLGEETSGWYTFFLESRLPESCEGWELNCIYSFIVDDKYRYRK